MDVVTKIIHIDSNGEADTIDLTEDAEKAVQESRLGNGVLTLFVQGSTGALTTMEYEEGLIKDLPVALERIAPKKAVYEHERRWHDGNGHSHVRASLIGPSLSIPFVKGKLTLGTWQQIVFVELDTKSRSREIVAQIIGE
jgi:secondary thiamine-phosphate synthase enzyme